MPFVPAFAEWHCPDQNALTYLGHRHPKPSCQAALELRLDAAARSASIKLRVPVALKACAKKTNIFVYILAERIGTLDSPDAANPIPEPVRQGLVQANVCARVSRLHLTLSAPPVVIVPAGTSLAPATTASGAMLALVRSLAQATDVMLYFPSKHFSQQRLATLCSLADGAEGGGLQPMAEQLDLASLHGGSGAEMVEGVDLEVPGPTEAESPPSYDELGMSPPPPPVEEAEGPKSKNKSRAIDDDDAPTTRGSKKPRLGPSPEDLDAREQALEARIALMFRGALDGLRCELRGEMQERLAALETKLEARIQEVAEEVKDEMGDHIDEIRNQTIDEADIRLDDQMFRLREEVREHVEEEMRLVEDKLKDDLCSAEVSLTFGAWD